MPHFYAAEPFKSLHANNWEETQSRLYLFSYCASQVLLCRGCSAGHYLFWERRQRGILRLSLDTFVLLCSQIHFLGVVNKIFYLEDFQFFACGPFLLSIAVILHNYGEGIRILFLFCCANHNRPSRIENFVLQSPNVLVFYFSL